MKQIKNQVIPSEMSKFHGSWT